MNTIIENKITETTNKTFKDACLGTCEKIAQQIRQAKNNILAEFRDTFQAHERLLQLAVTEADALAWQTEYPHLVFPLLATEKIQSAAQWQTRQQFLRGQNSVRALSI